MTLLPPQKKRSAGRPKENELLRELKVKTWFNAVAEASGKTAYELEKEFSPSYVDKGKFHKQRSRLWEKYRTGKVMPTMKETKGGRRPIALMVEEKYPGTLRWLVHSVWVMLDLSREVTMAQIEDAYKSLDFDVSRHFLQDDERMIKAGFWRRDFSNYYNLLYQLREDRTEDAFIALVIMYRETLICQQPDNYRAIVGVFKKIRGQSNLGIFKREVISLINTGW